MSLVTEKLINYIDLKNGRLNLYDLALISDAFTVKKENEYRIQEYWRNKEQN
jgi:hypothetical protein